MNEEKSLDEVSYENWLKADSNLRKDCIKHLNGYFPEDYIIDMKTNRLNGLSISDGNPYFHFGVGMQIRNYLRRAVADEELPGIEYEGELYKNWDDYYVGALIEFIEGYNGKEHMLVRRSRWSRFILGIKSFFSGS